MIALPRKNILMRVAHNAVMRADANDVDAVLFRTALQNVPEDVFEDMVNMKNCHPREKFNAMLSSYPEAFRGHLKVLLENYTNDGFRNMTKAGVLDAWKYVGAVLTVSIATTGDDAFQGERTDRALVINVVSAKRIECLGCIWG